MKVNVFIDYEDLIGAFQQGNLKALQTYFNEFYPTLCFYVCSYIQDMEASKEIASDAFVNTWKHREQFHSVGSIRAYLYTVARNEATAFHKKKQRIPLRVLKEEDIESLDADELQKLIKAETLRQIYNAMENLPPECRKIFRLLYVEGKKVSEIAASLKLSVSTVKAQKARGLTLLRKKILLLGLSISLLVEKIITSL